MFNSQLVRQAGSTGWFDRLTINPVSTLNWFDKLTINQLSLPPSLIKES